MEQAPLHHSISTAPADGEAFWVQSKDGVKLRVACWRPKQNDRGTIFIFPGRGDYIELFGNAVKELVENGYSTFVIDWRGHGLSDRVAKNERVGHVDQFEDYQRDVIAMVTAAQRLDLPRPWYLIGHSMGACIGLRSLIEGLDVIAAAFSAPMFDIHMASYERVAAWPLTWFMRSIGKGEVYAPGFNDNSYVFRNEFEGNTLTNSADEYQRWIMQGEKCPALHTGGPSMGWLYAALKETRYLSKLPSPNVTCLSMFGDQEETVGVPAIRDRMTKWENGRHELIAGAKHELFLETPEVQRIVMSLILDLFSERSVV